MNKRHFAAILIGLFLLPLGRADEAQPPLEKLYQQAQQDLQQTRTVDQQREKRFQAARDKLQAQVQELKKMLDQEHRREDQLKNEFTGNKIKLEQLRSQLARRSASLSTFFAAVRQAAIETTGVLHESLISAQYPGRDEITDKLADNSALPSVEQVEQLWRIMQQEMTESGKVVRFQTSVTISANHEKPLTVTRVGAFDLLAEGRYLEYLPDKRELSALDNLSGSIEAANLEGAANGYHVVGIDPTAGASLNAIMNARDFAAGVVQGHVVGLLSLGIGFIGLLVPIGAGRIRYLRSTVGAALFSFGIVILMSNMFKVFFGDFAQPVSYADVEIVQPEVKENPEMPKRDVLPEMKPHPEVLPVPERLALQQADLMPSVPSLMSMPKLSSDLRLAGSPMLGSLSPGSKMLFDNEVQPLVQIPPIYPIRAAMMHIGGMVILEFTINELGRAQNPTVVKSDPPKIFDQAAIQAILSWRFKPKLVNGQPVPRLARQRFDFNPRN